MFCFVKKIGERSGGKFEVDCCCRNELVKNLCIGVWKFFFKLKKLFYRLNVLWNVLVLCLWGWENSIENYIGGVDYEKRKEKRDVMKKDVWCIIDR